MKRIIIILFLLLVIIASYSLFYTFKKDKEIQAGKSDLLAERYDIDTVYQLLLNAEEKTKDIPVSVWPTTSTCLGGDMPNSTLYFNGITNSVYFKQFNYDYLSSKMFDNSNNSRWNVLIGISRNIEDKIPLMFSASIDPQKLIRSMNSSLEKNLTHNICTGTGVVLQKKLWHFYR